MTGNSIPTQACSEGVIPFFSLYPGLALETNSMASYIHATICKTEH